MLIGDGSTKLGNLPFVTEDEILGVIKKALLDYIPTLRKVPDGRSDFMNKNYKIKTTAKITDNYVPEAGEILFDEARVDKHLSYIKIGDGKHKFSELPYEPLGMPENFSNIKSYTGTKTCKSFIDIHDNLFVYWFDEKERLIKYIENGDYIERRIYNGDKLVSRISNLCDDNMIGE